MPNKADTTRLRSRTQNLCSLASIFVACEQAFGRAGCRGEGKASLSSLFFPKQRACSQARIFVLILKLIVQIASIFTLRYFSKFIAQSIS